MSIQRAWTVTCADGELRDSFANAVAHRITQIDNCPGDAYANPELVDDFVEKCDAIFAEHNPETLEAALELANEIDTTELYDLVQND
jgi:hypothetical protein